MEFVCETAWGIYTPYPPRTQKLQEMGRCQERGSDTETRPRRPGCGSAHSMGVFRSTSHPPSTEPIGTVIREPSSITRTETILTANDTLVDVFVTGETTAYAYDCRVFRRDSIQSPWEIGEEGGVDVARRVKLLINEPGFRKHHRRSQLNSILNYARVATDKRMNAYKANMERTKFEWITQHSVANGLYTPLYAIKNPDRWGVGYGVAAMLVTVTGAVAMSMVSPFTMALSVLSGVLGFLTGSTDSGEAAYQNRVEQKEEELRLKSKGLQTRILALKNRSPYTFPTTNDWTIRTKWNPDTKHWYADSPEYDTMAQFQFSHSVFDRIDDVITKEGSLFEQDWTRRFIDGTEDLCEQRSRRTALVDWINAGRPGGVEPSSLSVILTTRRRRFEEACTKLQQLDTLIDEVLQDTDDNIDEVLQDTDVKNTHTHDRSNLIENLLSTRDEFVQEISSEAARLGMPHEVRVTVRTMRRDNDYMKQHKDNLRQMRNAGMVALGGGVLSVMATGLAYSYTGMSFGDFLIHTRRLVTGDGVGEKTNTELHENRTELKRSLKETAKAREKAEKETKLAEKTLHEFQRGHELRLAKLMTTLWNDSTSGSHKPDTLGPFASVFDQEGVVTSMLKSVVNRCQAYLDFYGHEFDKNRVTDWFRGFQDDLFSNVHNLFNQAKYEFTKLSNDTNDGVLNHNPPSKEEGSDSNASGYFGRLLRGTRATEESDGHILQSWWYASKYHETFARDFMRLFQLRIFNPSAQAFESEWKTLVGYEWCESNSKTSIAVVQFLNQFQAYLQKIGLLFREALVDTSCLNAQAPLLKNLYPTSEDLVTDIQAKYIEWKCASLVNRELHHIKELTFLCSSEARIRSELVNADATLSQNAAKWSNHVPAWMVVAGIGVTGVGAALWKNHRRERIEKQDDQVLRTRIFDSFQEEDAAERDRLVREHGLVVDAVTRNKREAMGKYTLGIRDDVLGDTPLIHAAKQNKGDALYKLCFETDLDITCTNYRGESVLFHLHHVTTPSQRLDHLVQFLDNTPCKTSIHQTDIDGRLPIAHWWAGRQHSISNEALRTIKDLVGSVNNDETESDLRQLVHAIDAINWRSLPHNQLLILKTALTPINYRTLTSNATVNHTRCLRHKLELLERYEDMDALLPHQTTQDTQSEGPSWDRLVSLTEQYLSQGPFLSEVAFEELDIQDSRVSTLLQHYANVIRGMYSCFNRNSTSVMSSVSSTDFQKSHQWLWDNNVQLASVWLPSEACYPYYGTAFADSKTSVGSNQLRFIRGASVQKVLREEPRLRKVPVAMFFVRFEIDYKYTTNDPGKDLTDEICNALMQGIPEEGDITALQFAALCDFPTFDKMVRFVEKLDTRPFFEERSFQRLKWDETDAFGNSLLHYVRMGGNPQTLELLLEEAAPWVEMQASQPNDDGLFPHECCLRTEARLAPLCHDTYALNAPAIVTSRLMAAHRMGSIADGAGGDLDRLEVLENRFQPGDRSDLVQVGDRYFRFEVVQHECVYDGEKGYFCNVLNEEL